MWDLDLFINKYLLNVYSVTGTGLGSGYIMINEIYIPSAS